VLSGLKNTTSLIITQFLLLLLLLLLLLSVCHHQLRGAISSPDEYVELPR